MSARSSYWSTHAYSQEDAYKQRTQTTTSFCISERHHVAKEAQTTAYIYKTDNAAQRRLQSSAEFPVMWAWFLDFSRQVALMNHFVNLIWATGHNTASVSCSTLVRIPLMKWIFKCHRFGWDGPLCMCVKGPKYTSQESGHSLIDWYCVTYYLLPEVLWSMIMGICADWFPLMWCNRTNIVTHNNLWNVGNL